MNKKLLLAFSIIAIMALQAAFSAIHTGAGPSDIDVRAGSREKSSSVSEDPAQGFSDLTSTSRSVETSIVNATVAPTEPRGRPQPSPLGRSLESEIGTLSSSQYSFFVGNIWSGPTPFFQGGITATFDGVSNTIGGISSGDWVGVLPINLAYGPDTNTFSWIQFGVLFNYDGSVDFVLEQNNFANGNMDYGSCWPWNRRGWSTSCLWPQSISVSYAVGHTFLAQLFIYDSSHVEFALTDQNTQSVWTNVMEVPSTNVVYRNDFFSPATTVEGLIDTSATSVTGFPYFEIDIVNYMSSYADNTGVMCDPPSPCPYTTPSGVNYYTTPTFSLGWWRWAALSGLGLLPTPQIFSPGLSYPPSIVLGQTATIDIPVENVGGDAEWMTVQISFPTNPPLSSIAVDYAGTAPELNAIPRGIGSQFPSDYGFRIGSGSATVTTWYPLVEGASYWSSSGVKHLVVKVTPTTQGTFQFLIKTVAAFSSRAIRWDPSIYTPNAIKDQQSEYTYSYSIAVDVAPSSISVGVNPSSIFLGGGTTVSGSISTSATGDRSGTVYLQYSLDNINWNNIGSTSSDSTGAYSYFWTPANTGTFHVRVYWNGNSQFGGASSGSVVLSVGSSGGNLTDYSMCKSVASSSPYDCITRTSTFYTDDYAAYSWLNFENIYPPSHTVDWYWYDPDGAFISHFAFTIPDPSSFGYQYWAWYRTWSFLLINGYQSYYAQFLGRAFQTSVYYDGTLVVTTTWQVIKHDSSITIGLSSTSPTYGQSVTVSSQLSPSLSDGTITLQYTSDGVGWNTISAGTPLSGYYSSGWTPPSLGSFQVRAVWSGDPNYYSSTSSPQMLVVSPQPLTVTGSCSNGSSGKPVSCSASASGGTSPYQFSWTFGDGASGTGAQTSHSYATKGTFTVIVTVTDTNDASASAQSSVQISPQVLVITASCSDDTAGKPVTCTASVSGGTAPYSFGPLTFTFPVKGTYPVVISVTDSNGVTASTTVDIIVAPQPPVADFAYSPAPPTAGNPVTFTTTPSGGTGPYLFSWSFGDSTTGTGSSVVHSYAAKGTYTVILMVTDANGDPASVQQTIVVAPQPLVITGVNMAPAQSTENEPVTFTATIVGGTQPYMASWTFGDGTTGTGNPVSHSYATSGTYPVTVSVMDADGAIANSGMQALAWARTYGGTGDDLALSVQQTSDGGFIIAGGTKSFGLGEEDAWVLRLDSVGNVVWQKSYGIGEARSIQQTSDGGFVVAGFTETFSPASDAWVLRLDSSGDVVWSKTYGGSGHDTALSVDQTSDDGFVVTGNTRSFGVGIDDAWILRLDSSGDVVWSKTYGGPGCDAGYSVQQTLDGGFMVVGTRDVGSFRCVHESPDAWVARLNPDGTIAWEETFGVQGVSDAAHSVQQTTDGGFIVTGETEAFGGLYSADFWVLRLDSSGGVVWQTAYGGTGHDIAFSVQQTSDGGFAVAGFTSSFGAVSFDIWLLKLDASGSVVRQMTYGGTGDDEAFSVQETSDGGFIVAGFTGSFGAGGLDALVLKLDANGEISSECGLTGESSATVTSTAFIGTASNPTVTSPTVIGTMTSPTVTATSATSQLLCEGPPAITVTVWQKPDLDADGCVTIVDVAMVAFHFDSLQGDSRYSPQLDMDSDGDIDIVDIAFLATYFDTCGW